MEVPIRTDHLYTLSFGDYQVIIEQDEEDLSYMIRNLEEEHNGDRLQINIIKTDYLTTPQETIENQVFIISKKHFRGGN